MGTFSVGVLKGGLKPLRFPKVLSLTLPRATLTENRSLRLKNIAFSLPYGRFKATHKIVLRRNHDFISSALPEHPTISFFFLFLPFFPSVIFPS